jgi:hypothetical protein
MSLKVLCDVKSPQTTFTTGNITLERMFSKQEEKLLTTVLWEHFKLHLPHIIFGY